MHRGEGAGGGERGRGYNISPPGKFSKKKLVNKNAIKPNKTLQVVLSGKP
jgi:hypothetical protein